MSAEDWIFVVGFRIFDVGLLVFWLYWVFRMREESGPSDERRDGDDDGGPLLDPPDPRGGGGIELFPPGLAQAGPRRRGHARPAAIPRRTREPERPAPVR